MSHYPLIWKRQSQFSWSWKLSSEKTWSRRFPQTAPMFWFKTKWVKRKRLIFLFAWLFRDLMGLYLKTVPEESSFRNWTWRVSVSETKLKNLEVSWVIKRNDLRTESFFKVGWSDLWRVFRWYRPAKSEPRVLGPRNTLGKLSQRHWNSFLCRKIF